MAFYDWDDPEDKFPYRNDQRSLSDPAGDKLILLMIAAAIVGLILSILYL